MTEVEKANQVVPTFDVRDVSAVAHGIRKCAQTGTYALVGPIEIDGNDLCFVRVATDHPSKIFANNSVMLGYYFPDSDEFPDWGSTVWTLRRPCDLTRKEVVSLRRELIHAIEVNFKHVAAFKNRVEFSAACAERFTCEQSREFHKNVLTESQAGNVEAGAQQ